MGEAESERKKGVKDDIKVFVLEHCMHRVVTN